MHVDIFGETKWKEGKIMQEDFETLPGWRVVEVGVGVGLGALRLETSVVSRQVVSASHQK